MHVCTNADLGPDFIGLGLVMKDRVVCLVTPRVHKDVKTRALAVELLRRQGVDCGSCPGCPAGIVR